MVYPWDYPSNIILFWSEYGSFIAINKTQVECVRFWRDVVRAGRKPGGFPVHTTILDEASFAEIADEFEKKGFIFT